MITERQQSILARIIEEHITSARPVSSQFIEQRYDFNVCPATIRNDMQKLTETGFLSQPHISAGRVPTDKGYRFFVDNLLEQGISELEHVFEIRDFIDQKQDIFKLISHISKFLAMTSSNLAAIHLFQKDFFWKEGWEELLKEPEFEEKDFISNFTVFLKNFEKDIKNLDTDTGLKVFIGKENPFTKNNEFSIISANCYFPEKQKATVSLLGPKRMSYERNISLINSMVKLLQELE